MSEGTPASLPTTEGPPHLALDRHGVATLTLNRPSRRNSLRREDLLCLQQQLEQLSANRAARVLVITGQGRVFSAGFNLRELETQDASAQTAGTGDPQLFERTVDQLAALRLPTIARLNGSVYGGATDLALACDLIVGPQGMELRMPAARLGLHYYASGLQRFVARVGLAAAKRLFLLALPVSGAELLNMGYLDALVPPEDLDMQVQTYVQALLAGAPLAVQGMKQSLNELALGSADLDVLAAREIRCGASLDLAEGLAAIAGKRAPIFVGR